MSHRICFTILNPSKKKISTFKIKYLIDSKKKKYRFASFGNRFSNTDFSKSRFLLLQRIGAVFQSVRGFISQISETILQRLLTFRKNRTNSASVNFLSAHRHRKIQIKTEDAFNEPINRKPFQNFVFSEFDDAEQTENDPIRQPLRIVGFRRRFDSFDRDISRIQEADEIAKQFGEMTENQIQSEQSGDAGHEKKSIHSRFFFEFAQSVIDRTRFVQFLRHVGTEFL